VKESFPQEIELTVGPVAAASGDHNSLHLDAAVARAAGFDRPVVHGMLTMGYAGRLLTGQFGTDSVRALEVRFTGVAKLGDKVTVRASLAKVEDGIGHYHLRARTTAGTEILTGRARVARRPRGAV